MKESLLALLRAVDTPTVCNAIEVVEGKRGFDWFTHSTMMSSAPAAGAIVVYARTAKIAALHPPTEPPRSDQSQTYGVLSAYGIGTKARDRCGRRFGWC